MRSLVISLEQHISLKSDGFNYNDVIVIHEKQEHGPEANQTTSSDYYFKVDFAKLKFDDIPNFKTTKDGKKVPYSPHLTQMIQQL